MLTSLIPFEILFFSKRKKYHWKEVEDPGDVAAELRDSGIRVIVKNPIKWYKKSYH